MAETHQEWSDRTGHPLLDNIGPNDRIIWIKPGETILGHTLEYIGGRHTITSMMKARSSMGRNFIEVCKVCPSLYIFAALILYFRHILTLNVVSAPVGVM